MREGGDQGRSAGGLLQRQVQGGNWDSGNTKRGRCVTRRGSGTARTLRGPVPLPWRHLSKNQPVGSETLCWPQDPRKSLLLRT